jgi:hypothetical protein
LGNARSRESLTADPIELALAKALAEAAAAGRFDVVGQLARELEMRRLGQPSNVVAFEPGKRRRTDR